MSRIGCIRLAGLASRRRGIALLACLVMLVLVLLLGLSAARAAIQAELSARNERDRQVAFQAAEAALADAQRDIEQPSSTVRGVLFADGGGDVDSACGAGLDNPRLGLCAGVDDAWLKVDFLDDSSYPASVPYGRFSGSALPLAAGMLPARMPRYIIEVFTLRQAGWSAEPVGRLPLYRISALGFGMRTSTRVLLQARYRRARAG